MPSRNKRQYIRVDACGYALDFTPLKDKNFSRALLVNLSECGALILTPVPLQSRDVLQVRLHGIVGSDLIGCRARVVHLAGDRVHPTHYYAGIRFHDLLEQHKTALRAFIEGRQRHLPCSA